MYGVVVFLYEMVIGNLFRTKYKKAQYFFKCCVLYSKKKYFCRLIKRVFSR